MIEEHDGFEGTGSDGVELIMNGAKSNGIGKSDGVSVMGQKRGMMGQPASRG